jgi:predicted ATPase
VAGQQAVTRSAMTEAVAQLQKGLDLLAALPESPWRAEQELDLQMALGPALIATRGYAAPAVGETVTRARALAEQVGRLGGLVPLLYFQRVIHLVRAEHRLALSLAEQMEKVGEAQNDAATLLLGRFAHAVSHLFLGEFVAACTLCEQCHAMKDPARRAAYTAEDPYAMNLCTLALILTLLGHIDRARARSNEALSEAHRLEHVFTVTYVLAVASLAACVAGSPDEAERYAEEAIALSNEHGFPLQLGWGLMSRGWTLAARGRAQEGLAFLTEALSAIRGTGAVAITPWTLTMLAEANFKLRRPVTGLSHLAEAAQIINATDERFSEAELHRVKGELLNAAGDQAAAEQNYHQALAVAKRQSARTFELRAASSLARLWIDQGKRTEARELLAPIYGWFTEGFDTPDLKEAKALLDELS